MVQGKVLNWFDFQEYSLFRWLKENTPSWNYGTLKPSIVAEVWEDRTVAQETLKKYLAEYPCESARSRSCAVPNILEATITFIHGPQGSGKTPLVHEVLTSLGK